MTKTKAQELIDSLDEILDGERTAVLNGNMDDMVDFLERKEAIIDALNDLEPFDPKPIAHIQEKLDRNQALLDGALQGIRRAAAHLAAVRKVRRSLETYGEDGRRRTIDAVVTHKVEKRA